MSRLPLNAERGIKSGTVKPICPMYTERLTVRRLTHDDFDAVLAIMGKLEVMYAWEHGFSEDDVRKWIDRQLARYSEDGIGYFAVTLKESGLLIGQAGLMKTKMNGDEVVEVGYIFDSTYWHRGYATEVARHLISHAFEEMDLPAVYCSIRPENTASIRVAERLGMRPCGCHTVVYREKEMPHIIYKSDNYRQK